MSLRLVIDVEARAGTSLRGVFRPLTAASAEASRSVEANAQASGRKISSIYRDNALAGVQAQERVAAAAEKSAKKEEAAHERAIKHVADIRERAFREEQARGEAAESKAKARNDRIASASARTFGMLTRTAVGVLGRVAGGMGAELDPAALIGKVVASQLKAEDIATYGYMKGAAGPAGQRQSGTDIEADARVAARAGALKGGKSEALEGLAEFTKQSSDLRLGRDLVRQIAEYSTAMGVSFVDVSSTAGVIAKKLGDIPDKGKAVMAMLRTYGTEGKYGAIDMADMAKLIPSVIGSSNQFAEGTAGAMTKLGVALQVVKSFGGAKNPAQAATSVASFVGDLTSKAGLKSLTAAGLDPFADKGKTKLRGIDDIIVQALEKSGGDLSKMSALFSNKRSGAVLKGFGQIYSDAEAQQKGSGAAAVRETFKSYGAGGSADDVQAELQQKLATTAASVVLFNQSMEDAATGAMVELAPAMKELAPVTLDAAKSLGGMVTSLARHPEAAIVAALVTSIGKATLGPMLGEALKNSVGGAGALGGVLALGVVALSAEKVIFDARDKAATNQMNADLRLDEAETIGRGAGKKKEISAEDKKKFDQEVGELQARVDAAQKSKDEWNPLRSRYVEAAINMVGGGPDLAAINNREKDVDKLPELKGQLTALQAMQTTLSTGIRITNVAEIAAAVGGKGGAGPHTNEKARSNGMAGGGG